MLLEQELHCQYCRWLRFFFRRGWKCARVRCYLASERVRRCCRFLHWGHWCCCYFHLLIVSMPRLDFYNACNLVAGSISETTTRHVPDSTNGLAQQMLPERHKGNVRTSLVSPVMSRKTRVRLGRLWQTSSFPSSTCGARCPRPPVVLKRTVKQNHARTQKAIKTKRLGTHPLHAEPYWARVQRPEKGLHFFSRTPS